MKITVRLSKETRAAMLKAHPTKNVPQILADELTRKPVEVWERPNASPLYYTFDIESDCWNGLFNPQPQYEQSPPLRASPSASSPGTIVNVDCQAIEERLLDAMMLDFTGQTGRAAPTTGNYPGTAVQPTGPANWDGLFGAVTPIEADRQARALIAARLQQQAQYESTMHGDFAAPKYVNPQRFTDEPGKIILWPDKHMFHALKYATPQLFTDTVKLSNPQVISMDPLNDPNASYPQEERMWRNELDRATKVLRVVSQRPMLTGSLQKLQLAQVREAEAVLRTAQKHVDRYSVLRAIEMAERRITELVQDAVFHKKRLAALRKKLGKA